jgi:hypothetical protein
VVFTRNAQANDLRYAGSGEIRHWRAGSATVTKKKEDMKSIDVFGVVDEEPDVSGG